MTDNFSDSTYTSTESGNKPAFGFWFALLFGLVAIAQIARWFALRLEVAHYLNDKFAFSLNLPTALMYALYAFAMFFIGRYLFKHWLLLPATTKLGFTMIVAGGLANFGERLVFGHVVDYFYIANGVLNVADFFILLGIILIFVNRRSQKL